MKTAPAIAYFLAVIFVCVFRIGWKWHQALTDFRDSLIMGIVVDIVLVIITSVMLVQTGV